MITKDFCEQYVSLIPIKRKYSTEFHMSNIVEKGIFVANAFSEEEILQLSSSNRIAPQIYLFIVQNQHLWVDDKVEMV
jgi:hypothetical protein